MVDDAEARRLKERFPSAGCEQVDGARIAIKQDEPTVAELGQDLRECAWQRLYLAYKPEHSPRSLKLIPFLDCHVPQPDFSCSVTPGAGNKARRSAAV